MFEENFEHINITTALFCGAGTPCSGAQQETVIHEQHDNKQDIKRLVRVHQVFKSISRQIKG